MFFSKKGASKLFSVLVEHHFFNQAGRRFLGVPKCCKPAGSTGPSMNPKMLPFMAGCQDYMSGCPQPKQETQVKKKKKKKRKGILALGLLLGFLSFATIALLSSTFDENECDGKGGKATANKKED